METKKELRKRILNFRNSMTMEDVINKSSIIMNKLTDLHEYKNSKTVFVYMSFGNEVVTYELIKRMISENKRVVIPYTDTKNTVIIPSELRNMEEDLVLSSFGYYEPVYDKIKVVEPEEFDLIVTPGVVFDKQLNRVGFGKGYYDRILIRKRKDTKAVAVAYDFQVLGQVPSEKHDVKMDMIITEENIYQWKMNIEQLMWKRAEPFFNLSSYCYDIYFWHSITNQRLGAFLNCGAGCVYVIY